MMSVSALCRSSSGMIALSQLLAWPLWLCRLTSFVRRISTSPLLQYSILLLVVLSHILCATHLHRDFVSAVRCHDDS
jgi:hypothetical protein